MELKGEAVTKKTKAKSESVDWKGKFKYVQGFLPKILDTPNGPLVDKLKPHLDDDKKMLDAVGECINRWKGRVFDQNEKFAKLESEAQRLKDALLDLTLWRHDEERRLRRILDGCHKARNQIEVIRGETGMHSIEESVADDREAWSKELDTIYGACKEIDNLMIFIESNARI
jgi:hypothetical protein